MFSTFMDTLCVILQIEMAEILVNNLSICRRVNFASCVILDDRSCFARLLSCPTLPNTVLVHTHIRMRNCLDDAGGKGSHMATEKSQLGY